MTVVAEKFTLHEAPSTNFEVALAEDGQYLRVTLDKAQNYLDSAVHRLNEMFQKKFGEDLEALRVWYHDNVEVWEGTYYEHRAWEKVERYIKRRKTDRDYQNAKNQRTKRDLEELETFRQNARNQGVTSSQLRDALNKGHEFDPTVDHEAEDWVETFKAWPKAKQLKMAARIGLAPIGQA